MRRLLLLTSAVGVLLVLGALPAFASRVVIHEIYYNSPGTDDGSNSSLNGEWIQLKNTSGSKISLNGWTVRDTAGHVYTFGSYSIGASSTVKIHTGSGSNGSTNRYWNQGWYVWNNDTDKATLKDSKASTLDTCSYNNASRSYVMC